MAGFDLDLKVHRRSGRVRVAVRGKLDLGTAGRERCLAELRERKAVLLDLRELTFMDPTGLRALLKAREKRNLVRARTGPVTERIAGRPSAPPRGRARRTAADTAGKDNSGRVRTFGHAPAKTQELQPAAAPLVPVATGEAVDPRGLAAVAAEVAARQRSPETRRPTPPSTRIQSRGVRNPSTAPAPGGGATRPFPRGCAWPAVYLSGWVAASPTS